MLNPRQIRSRKMRAMVLVGTGGVAAFGAIGTWSGNEKFYKQFLSPFFAQMDPEVSHRAAIFVAKHHLIKNRNLPDPDILKTQLGRLNISNPIGIAAGFDKSAECMSGLVRMGFGWIEIGSVTPLPQEGNPKPRVFRLPEDNAVINRYGFNNDGHEQVHSRVQEFKRKYPSFVVGINLGANKTSKDRIQDYCDGVKVFSDCADYFIINISSPNTPNLRELQQSENLSQLLERVIAARNGQSRSVPLFLKVAPDLSDSDIKCICSDVSRTESRVDGLIVSNTTVGRDALKTESGVKMEAGGLSGAPLENISTELVGKFYRELHGQIPIIGVGGVCDGNGAFKKICAGASAVQMYTSLTFSGPGIVDRVKTELATLLCSNGYSSLTEAVGSAHRQTEPQKK